MTEWNRLFWLFFRFSGRISRAAFALSFLLTMVMVGFPLYKFMLVVIESGVGQTVTANEMIILLGQSADYGARAEAWSLIFFFSALIFSWSQVAIGVKRLHDLGKPGIIALTLMIPIVQVLALVILCVLHGHAGPNKYGRLTNAPA